jgi:hypothetical protein
LISTESDARLYGGIRSLRIFTTQLLLALLDIHEYQLKRLKLAGSRRDLGPLTLDVIEVSVETVTYRQAEADDAGDTVSNGECIGHIVSSSRLESVSITQREWRWGDEKELDVVRGKGAQPSSGFNGDA